MKKNQQKLKFKTGAIIQARMASTRLPGKVIKKIGNKTVLEHVIDRAKRINNCYKIVLATTDKRRDDVLEKIARKLKISVFRGSEEDVLDRYYQAAKFFKIDPVIRITADCPLFDPKIIDRALNLYFSDNYDYVSNVHPPTFPDGFSAEIFKFEALEKSWRQADLSQEREHVHPYLYRKLGTFKIGNLVNKKDFSYIRLTLDEKDDLTLIRMVYKKLYSDNKQFGFKEIIKLFEREPELIKINQHIVPHPISRWKKNQTKPKF